jgi:hypothetical protein
MGLGPIIEELRRERDALESQRVTLVGQIASVEEAIRVLLGDAPVTQVAPAAAKAARKARTPKQRKPGGASKRPPLAQVAAAALAALDEGRVGFRGVMEEFDVSQPTASKWIRDAREAGHDIPVGRGTPGSAPGRTPLDLVADINASLGGVA